jgi:hypothetical protein
MPVNKTWLKQGRYAYVGTKWANALTVVILDIVKDQVTWRWEDEEQERYMSVNMAESNLKNDYAFRELEPSYPEGLLGECDE